MKSNSVGSFFAKLREWKFKTKIDREVCDRIGAQLRLEGNFGYTFLTRAEMKSQTEEMKLEAQLAATEHLITEMPEFYGEAFRHIMHRELCERLAMFRHLAEKRIQPKGFDPRLTARHA